MISARYRRLRLLISGKNRRHLRRISVRTARYRPAVSAADGRLRRQAYVLTVPCRPADSGKNPRLPRRMSSPSSPQQLRMRNLRLRRAVSGKNRRHLRKASARMRRCRPADTDSVKTVPRRPICAGNAATTMRAARPAMTAPSAIITARRTAPTTTTTAATTIPTARPSATDSLFR